MSQLAQRLLMASGGKKDSLYLEDSFSTLPYYGSATNGKFVGNGLKLSNDNAGASVYFDGTADSKINIAASADFAMGSGDFTWEAFVQHIGSSNQYRRIICTGVSWGSDPSCGLMWDHASHNNKYSFYSWNIDTSGPFLHSATHSNFDGDGLWHHVAATRSGNTYTIWVDGVSEGTATHSGSFEAAATPTGSIGACFDTSNANECWSGYINDVRITKGQALYTTNFTPSTEALTTTSQGATGSNVKLLCCNNSTSASSATVTPNSLSVMDTNVTGESYGRFTGKGGKGGMVWIKRRDGTNYYVVVDTERGAHNYIHTDQTLANTNGSSRVRSFTNSGYVCGDTSSTNGGPNDHMVSWGFTKQEGFFDVVTYTGNSVSGDTNTQSIPHKLGCAPGVIFVKPTSASGAWKVYHTSKGNRWNATLNLAEGGDDNRDTWNNFTPTATSFEVGGDGGWGVNADGVDYVAYLFAGGQSPIDYSTYFDGNGDYLSMASSSDLQLDGDFTIEFWFYPQDTGTDRQTIIGADTAWGAGFVELQINNATAGTNTVSLWDYNSDAGAPIAKSAGLPQNTGQVLRQSWHHIAVVRKSNNIRIYIDGALANYTNQNNSATIDFGLNGTNIGKNVSGHYVNGKISNLRVVKGQAIYESNFAVPQSPLTTTSQAATESNVKLLCCNTSTNTGSTVTPGTITANGNVAANSDNPFMDAKSKIFGEGGDQNIIACGKYTGKSEGVDGPWVDLGWTPQWILIKRTDSAASWQLFDSMRGIATGGNDLYLNPNTNTVEVTSQNRLRLEPLGFRLDETDGDTNVDNGEFVYMAIRGWDGLVSKPTEAGTEVFAMDTGNGGTLIPVYDSGFSVDWSLRRQFASADSWISGNRLMGGMYLVTNEMDAEANAGTNWAWDSILGWSKESDGSSYQSWMWKNCAGFQALTYKGNGQAGRKVAHSMGVAPEMIWTKARKPSGAEVQNWVVYHKGLNGGTNPADYRIYLDNANAATNEGVSLWNSTIPDTRYFTLGTAADTNDDAGNYYEYMCYLFASVDGISMCGYYDGLDSTNPITTGFQPRFVIIKRVSGGTGSWYVLDTTRGWGAGDDKDIKLNMNNAQSDYDIGAPNSTGFTLTVDSAWNSSGNKYIYYAHA